MKYELEATIPVVQYGNIKPKFEIENEEEEASAVAIIKGLWDQYGEQPLKEKEAGGEKLTTFTGEEVLYNDDTHCYYDLDGNKLLSGSIYASQIMPKFDRGTILPKTAKAWGVDEKNLGELWDLSGKVSTAYGNAVHYALEMFHDHGEMGQVISEKKDEELNYALAKIPHIRECVKSFADTFGLDAHTEVLVSDVANKRAGRIDRLDVLDEKKKVCRIGDFKTNYDLTKKKIEGYQHQLSFYAHILQAHGWTVEGLDIYHFADEWEKIELEVVDLQK